MREQFQRVPYNYLIKKLNICNIPFQKVKNTTFDEFFRCIRYLGFHCMIILDFIGLLLDVTEKILKFF